MYNYFPHPSNARSYSGLVALRIDEGAAGYGVYWMIVELLRDAPNFRYSYSAKAIAFALNHADVDQVQRVITAYGLFDQDDNGLLYSPWLDEQMGNYSTKKAKLREAGRKGAARRWSKNLGDDGQAMATPSRDDGQAMAYNITQHNITKSNPTLTDGRSGQAINDEFIREMCDKTPPGCNWGYVAQLCRDYGMTDDEFFDLLEAIDQGDLHSTRYQAWVTIVKRIQSEKFRPKAPLAFFMAKLNE